MFFSDVARLTHMDCGKLHTNVCRAYTGSALTVAVCCATLCLCIDAMCGVCVNNASRHEIDSIVETHGETMYEFGPYVGGNAARLMRPCGFYVEREACAILSFSSSI